MKVTLENLKTKDLKAYHSLLTEVLGEVVDWDIMVAKFKENHPSFKVVVAKKDSEIIGTISFSLIDSFTQTSDPRIEFSNFAVTSAARGTDAAKMLMNFVTDYARADGYKSVVVNCGINAERAHAFYEKMGFKRADAARFVLVT